MGVCALAWLASGALLAGQPTPQTQATSTTSAALAAGDAAETHGAVLQRYCVTCHNDRLRTAGLTLEELDLSNVGPSSEVWEKVVLKLRSRTMPPANRPRPDDAAYEAIAGWLETSLDDVARMHPNPGRPLLHRMNRTEYRNAVRDLLALDADVTDALPADDAAYGFDNIGSALGVSPLLIESYVTAARKISRLALGNPDVPPVSTTYKAPEDLTQRDHLSGLPLGTRGGLRVDAYLPADAEYEIRVRLRRTAGGTVRGIREEHHVELTLDGARIGRFAVGGPDAYRPIVANDQNPGQTVSKAFTADDGMVVRLPIDAGDHTIAAAFVSKPAALEEQAAQPFLKSFVNTRRGGLPDVDRVIISGPFEAVRARSTASRDRIFMCRPTSPGDELACATTILSTLGRLAYRRPLEGGELEDVLGFYHEGRGKGDFETGIELALRFILASPQFVFRAETEPLDLPTGGIFQLTDLDLASRLSFFLWSSIPDDELLAVAESGRLSEPAELERQMRRMLADPRSEALVRNFAGQWLFLRNLSGTQPDPSTFPDFDDNLRQSLRRETELFFESIVREDRSVLDLMTADYTFVNERLARHYGIPGVYGDRFRRVPVVNENRRGLLGHGSILTVTSYATRTSPVLRGKWILENLLAAPPPPPPPNVPDLEDTGAAKALPMRERLARHRANPVCASCHSRMDPLGFGLENFDAIGRWRTVGADGEVINAKGAMADGTPFDGPAGLREALMARPEAFVTTLTRKLLTYATGRGLEYSDGPIVRGLVRQAAENGYQFSSIVRGIVTSDPFRMKKGAS